MSSDTNTTYWIERIESQFPDGIRRRVHFSLHEGSWQAFVETYGPRTDRTATGFDRATAAQKLAEKLGGQVIKTK